MDAIKLCWLYFRNALGAVSLLWPIALAAWVFHMALGLGDAGGLWLAILGAGAVLVFFRSYWRLWAILFPEVWRGGSRPLRDNLPIGLPARFRRACGASARTGTTCAGRSNEIAVGAATAKRGHGLRRPGGSRISARLCAARPVTAESASASAA